MKYVSIMSDMWSFLKVRKKFWLLPMMLLLLMLGVIISLTAGSALAPFIYTLF
jgi:hypothetical protein